VRNGEGQAFGRSELRHRYAQKFAGGGVEYRSTGVAGVEHGAQRPSRRAGSVGVDGPQAAVRDYVLEPLSVCSHAGTADDHDLVAVLMVEAVAQRQGWKTRVDRQKRQVLLGILRHERQTMPARRMRHRIEEHGLKILRGLVRQPRGSS
jgi:hypothetical protein